MARDFAEDTLNEIEIDEIPQVITDLNESLEIAAEENDEVPPVILGIECTGPGDAVAHCTRQVGQKDTPFDIEFDDMTTMRELTDLVYEGIR